MEVAAANIKNHNARHKRLIPGSPPYVPSVKQALPTDPSDRREYEAKQIEWEEAHPPKHKSGPDDHDLLYIEGDLFSRDTNTPDNVIVCSINAVDTQPRGRLEKLAGTYSFFDPFNRRVKRSGGDVLLFGDGTTQPIIAAFVAQNQKGISGESPEVRADYFARCLDRLERVLRERNERRTVLFPYLIGCASGCGNWADYSAAIHTWSLKLADLVVVKIVCHNA